ncbi:MAG: hypothetical protein K2M95_06170 [Clostridiales bacterium]|nr:hypothetical protein [Clostridiales bacterium]
MTVDDLYIVNYCHKNCTPLQNIMRLPQDQAFDLAREMAAQNQNTTAFYRFADFENYYPRRLQADKLLFDRFTALGGKPKEKHPLSFVLQGSAYLHDWFGGGHITKFKLSPICEDAISFSYGDSMSALQRDGFLTVLTKRILLQAIAGYEGGVEDFLINAEKQYRYIEVQVWDDACLPSVADETNETETA